MEFTAQQIAEIVQGEIIGNPETKVNSLSKIEEGVFGSISFLANQKYNHFIYDTKASIVIVNKTFVPEKPISTTLIKVEDAYQCFALLLNAYNKLKPKKVGVDKQVSVSKSAKLGKEIYLGSFTFIGENVEIADNVSIYPNCYIGDNVKIGANTLIYSGVKIYENCIIGNECTLHSGVVIGADGFGFAPQIGAAYKKIAQIGNVVIEDNVEIGSNTTIDRATMGSTIIHQGVKIDNLVMIAHNVVVGENTVIVAQTGISGSTHIGSNCVIGGQVGIAGHLTIGNNVTIQAQSGIASNLKDEAVVQGSPAYNLKDFLRSYVYFRNLPAMVNRLEILEKKKP